MKLFLYLALCSCAVPTLAQPQPVQSQIGRYTHATPRESIELSVRDFAEAINDGSFYQAQSYVADARMGYFGAQVQFRDFAKDKPFDIEVWNVEPLQLEETRARIAVTYRLNPTDNTAPITYREILDLKRGPGLFSNPKTKVESQIWQIVLPATRPAEPRKEDAENFGWFSYLSWKIAQKPLTPADYDVEQSLKNLKDLSVATMNFSQDYDSIAASPEYLEEYVAPYLKNTSSFFVPNSYEHYSFNANLSGRYIENFAGVFVEPLANLVVNPEKVVLFYEGRDEKLNFRYDGKAAVSFADGHVALVSPDEAKNLRWIP